MAKYEVKTTFPADESVEDNKYTTTKRNVLMSDVETADVVKLFNSYRTGGYKVGVSFKQPEDGDTGEAADPFTVAENLTKQGIDYKATLKSKSKGAYDDMLDLMHLIEASGFDMTVNVQLKINEETSLNVDDPASWSDQDAVIKVTPKASSTDINELKDLYDNLDNKGYEVEITVKPKMPKDDDMDSENNGFASQLSAYPTGTTVNFNLTQDED